MGRTTTKGLLQVNKMQADTIDALRARVADLEAANATKDAALREELDERGHIKGCVGRDEPGNWISCFERCKRVRAALSDEGEGKVGEQARQALQMWDDYDNLSYREFRMKYPWLHADYSSYRQERLMYVFTRAALDALGGGDGG